jgi:hypothetical protein
MIIGDSMQPSFQESMNEARKVMSKHSRFQVLSEKFLQDNQPSMEINDYLSDCQNLMFQLEQMFFKKTDNRNEMMPDALKIIQQLKDRSDLALERLKISSPEDENK